MACAWPGPERPAIGHLPAPLVDLGVLPAPTGWQAGPHEQRFTSHRA